MSYFLRPGASDWTRFGLAWLCMLAILPTLASEEAKAAATGQESPQSIEADFRRAEEIDALMQGMPAFLGGPTMPLATVRNLAPRYAETPSSFPNPHVSSETDFFRKFEFDGMELYGALLEPSVLTLISVVVTKPGWPIGRGLSVGVPEQAVLNALGPPGSESADLLVYHGVTDSMTFHVADHRVFQVTFEFYFD